MMIDQCTKDTPNTQNHHDKFFIGTSLPMKTGTGKKKGGGGGGGGGGGCFIMVPPLNQLGLYTGIVKGALSYEEGGECTYTAQSQLIVTTFYTVMRN